jgi:sarcosine oxidase subunit delta
MRDETEFHCGGESHIARPGPAEKVDDKTWGDYLFFRDNPKGWHFERWCHVAGCGQWFNAARHTVTHEIRAVYLMTESRPEVKS